MAHKNVDYKPEDILFPNQKIVQSELVHEMQSSYIEYAMSVIVGRALPDVRDGLKPVHRRILYAMYEDGLTSDKPFKKSATCVGDVLGRYHPHGDASVYDALVRLAQDFSMRYMLVDGHGNFGSIDGDPPAAYRYTEARMSKIANEMLRDIDKETVDWDPNFDESRKEPRVLPARFPNLLVNGSSGIAVGMATNIPPHNLTEVINACVCVLDNPEATLYDLMQHITGPDFPTKGIIMGRSGIRAAYATGRGKIILRARTEFEEFGRDRTRIIVTELPYQVNKRMLIKNMADQVNDKRLEGISDIRDETDRTGMRIVIEVKHDANPQVVLNRLFAQTQLQTSFAINMLALVDNQKQPKILSLRHIIDEYLAFQEELITRRTQYDLKKAREREHLLQGLLIAQDNIDEVIHIIRTSYDDAKEKLMERFSLSDIQAQAILDMRLKALQGLDREKLQNEYKELEDRIAYYERVLGDMGLVKSILKDELTAIRDKYGDERRTEIMDVEDDLEMTFTDTDYWQLMEYVAVTLRRVRKGNVIVEKNIMNKLNVNNDQYTAAKNLFDTAIHGLQAYLGLEIRCMAAQFIVFSNHGLDDEINMEYFDAITREFLEHLKAIVANKRFVISEGLVHDVSLFIQKKKAQETFAISKRYDFRQDIKHRFPSLYGITLTTIEEVESCLKISFTDDDIAYIVMLINNAIDESDHPVNAVFISAADFHTSKYQANKIMRNVENLAISKILHYEDIKESSITKFELIITTVPLELKKNVLLVSREISDDDLEKISRAITEKQNVEVADRDEAFQLFDPKLILCDVNAKRKEDVISRGCQLLYEKGYVKKGFEKKIWEREKTTPTSIGNSIAVPHGYKTYVKKSGIVVMRLKRPMNWTYEDRIEIVFLMAIDFNTQSEVYNFFQQFYAFIDDRSNIKALKNARDEMEIWEILQQSGITA